MLDMRAFGLVVAIFAAANALAFQLLFASKLGSQTEELEDSDFDDIEQGFGNEYRSGLSSIDMIFTMGGQWTQNSLNRAAYPWLTWPLAVLYMLGQSVVMLNLLIVSRPIDHAFALLFVPYAQCSELTRAGMSWWYRRLWPTVMKRFRRLHRLKDASSLSRLCLSLSGV